MTNILNSLKESIFGKVIAEQYSHGARIQIIKKGPAKELIYNNTIFSRIEEGKLLTHSYWDYFLPLPSLFSKPRILIIGLGGGTIPYQMESIYKDARIDVVESDETIISMYRSFIGSSLRSNIILGDGLEYMEAHDKEYDIVVLDAYIDDKMPDIFFSDRFVAAASKSIKERGVLAINYTLTSLGTDNSKNFILNLGKRFSLYSLGMSPISGNKILLCSKGISESELKGIASIPKLKEEHSHITRAYSNMVTSNSEVI